VRPCDTAIGCQPALPTHRGIDVCSLSVLWFSLSFSSYRPPDDWSRVKEIGSLRPWLTRRNLALYRSLSRKLTLEWSIWRYQRYAMIFRHFVIDPCNRGVIYLRAHLTFLYSTLFLPPPPSSLSLSLSLFLLWTSWKTRSYDEMLLKCKGAVKRRSPCPSTVVDADSASVCDPP